MKIMVYGAGVIGSIIAAKLYLHGEDVTVLARGNRLVEIRKHGIVLSSPKTKQQEVARMNVIETLLPDMKYDYIFVIMQRTQVNEVLPDIARNCSPNVIFVVNTAGGYDEWIKQIGKDRVMIAFPSAGGERRDGIVNYFIGKGMMRLFQTTTIGSLQHEQTDRVRNMKKVLSKAGIPTVFCADMDAWQKTHVAMVTGIANALYEYKCDNRQFAKSYQSVKGMVLAIKEGFAVLYKLGIKTTPKKLCFFHLPTSIVSIAFKRFMSTQLAEITMVKHCRVARREMICLQEEFDCLIKESGLPTPNIDRLRMFLKN